MKVHVMFSCLSSDCCGSLGVCVCACVRDSLGYVVSIIWMLRTPKGYNPPTPTISFPSVRERVADFNLNFRAIPPGVQAFSSIFTRLGSGS